MGQNINRSEPSLKDIVRDQLRINLEVGNKLLATDKILESIDSKMNNFTVAVQNHLNFNKVFETWITQLAAALPHPNGRDFPGQPAVPIKENVKAVITRSRKIMVEPKVKSKKYESLRHREFAHTHVYDVNLLERVGLDDELPTTLWTISWGKLYDKPRLDLGSVIFTTLV
jgi:hypothetical protein